ncbi:MAG: EamA family transporter [Candidatus Obscuribacterales bacterium]|nr:EamA family transporter [Candidatus Obscuribacterales bacterium]
MPKLPLQVWFGLVLAVVLDTAVQISWKAAEMNIPSSATAFETILATLMQPLFYGAALMFVVQYVNWMNVLKHVDLSFAQPITSLSNVTILLLSASLLHEDVTLTRWAGVALILAGVWFISTTKHKTNLDDLTHEVEKELSVSQSRSN